MNTEKNKTQKWKGYLLAGAIVLAFIGFAAGATKWNKLAWRAEAGTQLSFESPSAAGTALDEAAKSGDQDALVQILGGEAKALITTGDGESDKAAMREFSSKYQQMNRWVDMSDGSRVLYIGADNFAFPVPLSRNASGKWYFDAVAGSQEIRAREIGRNELLAIDACYALANAEEVYFARSSDAPEYAQRVISTEGKQDGLYWPASDASGSSPLAQLSQILKSEPISVLQDQPLVLDGYALRILTAQGEDASGGAQNYVVNGQMTGGFAILATPAKYAETGIMTFMISREGLVFERDFGPDTAKLAASIHEYDPNDDWSPVE